MSPPLIALEEHYYSKAVFDSLDDQFKKTISGVPELVEQLRDVGAKRLGKMDEGNISLQVISHSFTPGSPNAQDCRDGNDQLAADIAKSEHPSRFAAFAVLPVSDPVASERELERCVRDLGFVGALVDNHANGKHFDSPNYDPFWAKAAELDVPVYLHPTFPSPQMAAGFMGSYPPNVGVLLGGPGWGWHPETGLHVLKLFAAGVFDRFPKLKIVLGHFGETLPFMMERLVDYSARFAGGWGKRERAFDQVWAENIWITTSGVWSLAPLKCLLHHTSVDRIMYSVDFPYETNARGRKWFEELESSGLLTKEELEKVAYRNAEQLLRIKVAQS